jgi:hypothetical protein
MVGGINAVHCQSAVFKGHCRGVLCSHSTKEMSLPVLPPTLPRAFLALLAALEIAGPAELVTLDRPSEAFETEDEAVSFALAAVSAAVEACRNCPLKRFRDWRRTFLDTTA